jgi:hypothetical protein
MNCTKFRIDFLYLSSESDGGYYDYYVYGKSNSKDNENGKLL